MIRNICLAAAIGLAALAMPGVQPADAASSGSDHVVAIAATGQAAAIDALLLDLPLPHPSEIPALVRKLAKMLGKALGFEFALKVAACAATVDNAVEFRTCLRKILQMEIGK